MIELTWFQKLLDFIFDRNIFCKIGMHTWSWELESGEPIYLNGKIPDKAVCRKCSKKYNGK